jgi:V/A-type H+-transporting ATPase subunit I
VVSYLRLFAVGYATVVLATTFNGMAAEGAHGFVGGLMAALILFAGHALNIILAMMAVVVHGIRLNMLEFSGHLGMQWSGKKYDPFSEK